MASAGAVVLLELRFDKRQRQRCAEHRAVEVGQHVRHRADMILVAMGQHERRQLVLLQLPQIRDDEIDAKQFRFGKHDAGVNQDGGVAAGDNHHVHPEFAKPAQRDQFQGRRITDHWLLVLATRFCKVLPGSTRFVRHDEHVETCRT